MVAFKYKSATPFGGKSGKQHRYKKEGVTPACEQGFVSLAPLFGPLLAITSLCLLENSLFFKFTSGLTQSQCGLAHIDTQAISITESIVYTNNWANPHNYIIGFFLETFNFKVSLKKTVINYLGKINCKCHTIFHGSAVLKV